MNTPHFLCLRCGLITTDCEKQPDFCRACGGVEFVNLGLTGEYNVKELRHLYHIPFRADHYK